MACRESDAEEFLIRASEFALPAAEKKKREKVGKL